MATCWLTLSASHFHWCCGNAANRSTGDVQQHVAGLDGNVGKLLRLLIAEEDKPLGLEASKVDIHRANERYALGEIGFSSACRSGSAANLGCE